MQRKDLTPIFAFIRTLIVAPLFVALWMYFVPRWLIGPDAFAAPQPLGWILVVAGLGVAVSCVWEFAWRGLGTPAPFDPPRRLVVQGPYRFVRNPMYLGVGIALIGEGLVFPNLLWFMLALTGILWIAVMLFVTLYEEPTLRRMFGAEYENYCRNVRRWLPRLRPFDNSSGAAVQ